MPPFKRITIDPSIMAGRPCIRGLRVTVGMIVDLVNDDWTTADIRKAYPRLVEADIEEALRYAALGEMQRRTKKPPKK